MIKDLTLNLLKHSTLSFESNVLHNSSWFFIRQITTSMLVAKILYFNINCCPIFAESKIKERFKIKIAATSNINF